jgi:delta24-sterol reductase
MFGISAIEESRSAYTMVRLDSTRKSQYRRGQMVDTSAMSHILKIDTERKTALVEPNVPMDSLVEATLQHGLIPPVVMEFPGITVGGGFAGTSGESSSFRYGPLHP